MKLNHKYTVFDSHFIKGYDLQTISRMTPEDLSALGKYVVFNQQRKEKF